MLNRFTVLKGLTISILAISTHPASATTTARACFAPRLLTDAPSNATHARLSQSEIQSPAVEPHRCAARSRKHPLRSPGAVRIADSSNGPRHATSASSQNTSANSQNGGAVSPPELQVVLVTAQKRLQPLLDVPVPVTVLNAEALVAQARFRLEDYYTSVPGLSVTPGETSGAPQLAIRGVTTGGFTNPTVGIIIDDVPFGSSSYLDYGNEAPDINPSDLAQIEVLRGPQGTLYGASSIGGLIKYTTISPSTARTSGHVEAGLSHVSNGAELGYYASGAVNVPLSSEVAVRASAFARLDPGYVDNVLTGRRGVNRGTVEGAHISGLWKPSEDLSIKLSGLIQEQRVDGSPEVAIRPGLTDLQQTDIAGTGWRKNQIRAVSAIVAAKLGAVALTSITGFTENLDGYSYDYTPALGAFTNAEFGVSGTPLLDHTRTKRTTQELRLSSFTPSSVDWLFGLYFSRETSRLNESLLASDPLSGAVVLDWGDFDDPNSYTETAAFADVTFHVTHRFDIQVGGRESHDQQTLTEITTGLYDPLLLGVPSPVIYPETRTDENAFTYLFTPQLRISPELMVYIRLASGFRPGGANANATTSGLSHFDPDKTQNYELGAKGEFLDHRLAVDASLYYIDWKDIQLQLRNPVTYYTYFANGSRAKSEGVELSVQARPVAGLTLGGWIASDDAILTQDLPATSTAYGLAGSRLPASSRFSANASVEEEFPIRDNLSGFVGGIESYVGSREGIFTAKPQRQIYPAYARTDLRTGLRFGAWSVTLAVINAMNRRGILTGGLGTLNPATFYYIQPRTVSLTVSGDLK
ncbi:MAG TPA: TonB-dependent receptor plug domain-containing protein [Steroidobacteraceae bacterium]